VLCDTVALGFDQMTSRRKALLPAQRNEAAR
jgi:hypothetical protein